MQEKAGRESKESYLARNSQWREAMDERRDKERGIATAASGCIVMLFLRNRLINTHRTQCGRFLCLTNFEKYDQKSIQKFRTVGAKILRLGGENEYPLQKIRLCMCVFMFCQKIHVFSNSPLPFIGLFEVPLTCDSTR